MNSMTYYPKRDGRTTIHRGTYNSWRAMKERCYNQNYQHYQRYGGRGITVCKRWLGEEGFANFLADMGDRPDGMTLDRIDCDGNYAPENCRWANQKTQVANSARKKSARVTAEEIANAKCSMALVYKRLRSGWSKEDALNTPAVSVYEQIRQRAMLTHNICPICGKRCRRKRDRYCSMECFRKTRSPLGTFERR